MKWRYFSAIILGIFILLGISGNASAYWTTTFDFSPWTGNILSAKLQIAFSDDANPTPPPFGTGTTDDIEEAIIKLIDTNISLIHYGINDSTDFSTSNFEYQFTAADLAKCNDGSDNFSIEIYSANVDGINYPPDTDPEDFNLIRVALSFSYDDGGPIPYPDETIAITSFPGNPLVEAVPIPAAVWLCGSGFLAIIGFRRKSMKKRAE